MRSITAMAIVFLTGLHNITTFGQRVAWACEVVRASPSYYDKEDPYASLQSTQYATTQVLGPPNIFPAGGLNPGAWTTKKAVGEAFITVSFCDTLPVHQIILVETFHPGAMMHIHGYDRAGKEYDLGRFTPERVPQPARVQRVFFPGQTKAFVRLKITFQTGVADGQIGIDAIGISDLDLPYPVGLDLAPNLNPQMKPMPLSSDVNSSVRELNPVMTPDHNQLFFSRAFHPENAKGEHDPEDVWVARRDPRSGRWLAAQHMDSVLNTAGPNYVSSIHARNDTLIFLMANKYGRRKVTAGLTMFHYANRQWSDPINMEVHDFYNLSRRGNFYLAQNDSIVVMSVMREDTYGGNDLYVTFANGATWTEPLNLGATINSASQESTPFLMDDNRTLFFASDGHRGLGGVDLFVSHRLDNTWQHWSTPQNLGPKLNTAQDEFGLTLSEGKFHFIRGTQDNTDIWEVSEPLFAPERYALKVRIKTITPDGRPLPHSVIDIVPVIDMKTNLTDTRGILDLDFTANVRYSISARLPGYEVSSRDTIFTKKNGQAEVVLKLRPLEESFREIMNLEIVYFDFDKSDLKPEFSDYLDRIAAYIVKQNIRVELLGHTDAKGTEGYNHPLSIRRASRVRDYLIGKGVGANQLIVVGFGESVPAQPNVTREGKDNSLGRKMNRRVEFRLMGLRATTP
jgi:outer membrane protein OmpA-like peptidoglycan-associated protein